MPGLVRLVFGRKRYRFRLSPSAGLTLVEEGVAVRWRCTAPPASFDLQSDTGALPSGWVLLTTRLVRKVPDFTANLCIDLGCGEGKARVIEPPMSLKGILHELIDLPRDVQAIRWAPVSRVGEFTQWPIEMREVGWAERLWRMVRRVVPTLFRHPLRKRRLIGLTAWHILTDLSATYHAAGKLRAYAPAPHYQDWIRAFDRLDECDCELIRRHLKCLQSQPKISVLMCVSSGVEQHRLEATIVSVRAQLYRNWELCVGVHEDAPPKARSLLEEWSSSDPRVWVAISEPNYGWEAAFALASGSWVILLSAEDRLAQHALYRIATEAAKYPEARVLYSDEDRIDDDGERSAPAFKPDWNPQLLLSQNYIGRLVAFDLPCAREHGGFRPGFEGAGDYDLLLRTTAALPPQSIRHIPEILYHSHRIEAGELEIAAHWDAGRRALKLHLDSIGAAVAVIEKTAVSDGYHIRYSLPDPLPLVSILIPTRDRHDLLKRCVDSILERTTYQNFEVLVIDNGSQEPESINYLQTLSQCPRTRVLAFDLPFNFSAINNFAASKAHGEVLCLLNNDTEVITKDWLEEMLGYLQQPAVGIVGAKLLYPDHRIQHAGVLVGVGGLAHHAHAFLDRNEPGYLGRACLAQDLSAVTAACMLVRAQIYRDLSGFDAEHLPVAFNDVDFCLRVREAGWRVVWTPHAELYHHESASRGVDDTREKMARFAGERAYMHKRWAQVLKADPSYNPNLSYERPDFSLSHTPMSARSWLRGGGALRESDTPQRHE